MKISKEPVLGILGGMGPYATIDFVRNIYDLTKGVSKDSDHIRIIADNNVKIPSRTRAILYKEESPVEGMISSLEGLEKMGASVIAVPCNSAHYFYNDVKKKSNANWLNMIEVVSTSVFKKNLESPLIFGGYVTVTKKIYSNLIPNAKYLEEAGNNIMYSLIEDLKVCSNDYDSKITQLIELFHNSGCDSILLACTELTAIAAAFENHGIHIIDSNKEYALSLINLIK
jgi:aspartate racemase